jgi:hypothetical protein
MVAENISVCGRSHVARPDRLRFGDGVHEGMDWGAVARKRTPASEPVELDHDSSHEPLPAVSALRNVPGNLGVTMAQTGLEAKKRSQGLRRRRSAPGAAQRPKKTPGEPLTQRSLSGTGYHETPTGLFWYSGCAARISSPPSPRLNQKVLDDDQPPAAPGAQPADG